MIERKSKTICVHENQAKVLLGKFDMSVPHGHMRHASTTVVGGKVDAEKTIKALKKTGVHVADAPARFGATLK